MSNVTFRASTSLMEDYRLGTEITPQTAITQLVNAAGESELFYTGRDGQRGITIYNVRPDINSDTGWTVSTVTPDTLPGQLAGGAGSDGTFTLFFVGPDTSNPDIHYAQRDTNGNWGAWQVVDASSVFANLTPPVYVRSIAAEVVGGAVELAAVLSDPTGQLSIWRVDWTGELKGWLELGDVDSSFLNVVSTLTWGDGILGAQMNAAVPAAVDLVFFSLDGTTTATVAAQQYFRSADSALQTPTSTNARYSGIFLYNDGLNGGTRSVSFIDTGVAAPAPVVIDTTLTCTQIVAVEAGPNPITFFALDLNMRLNVISYDTKDGVWVPPIELGEDLSSMTAGLASDGAPVVFAIDARGSTLYSILEQPPSAGGEWTKQEIEAQVQTIEKISVYGTSFTLMDAGGNALTNTTLSVTSTETMTLSWRGQVFVVGPGTSWALTTDSSGRVTLYAQTGSITVSKLLFSVPGLMDDGDAIVVDADDGSRQRLQNLTVAEVQGLLPSQYQADAAQVQQAVTTAMSYAPPPSAKGSVKNARYVSAANRTAGYRRPVDPCSAYVKHWRFTVRDGRANFSVVTPAAAAALRAQILADAPNGVLDFDWLPDIIDAVEDAVETAFDYVVSEVGGVIRVTIDCFINGIKYVFDAVIDSVETAFQVVSAIFSSVLVFFQALFEFLAWLLSGARQDIWNTKKVFEGVINQSFPALTNFCTQGESAAAGFFAALKQTVAADFDAAIAAVGSDTFDYESAAALLAPAAALQPGAGAGITPGDVLQFFLDGAVKINWLMDKIESALGAPSFSPSLPQPVKDAFASFANSLASAFGSQILADLAAVGSYISSVAANPAAFMGSTLAGLLNAAKNIVLDVLDVLDALTQAFFQLAIAFLAAAKSGIFDQGVGGFFLNLLYDLLNPEGSEDLTVTRFVSIVCAFPTTVLYRIITGSSPFSLDAETGELVAAAPNVYKQIGGLLTCFWSIVDARLDVPPADEQALILGTIVPILLAGLLTPGPMPLSLQPWDTNLNKARNSMWCTRWGAITYASLFTACTDFAYGPRRDPISCGILSVLGVPILAAGIWKGVEEERAGVGTFGNWFINLMGPLVTISKSVKFVAPPAGLAAVLVLDFVGDIGVGAITYENA